MKKTIEYLATGRVLRIFWGGTVGSYLSEKVIADTKEELIITINQMLKDGSLDSGNSDEYQSLIGALMNIETIETVTIDNKKYIHREIGSELFGELTKDQKEFLIENDMKILLSY